MSSPARATSWSRGSPGQSVTWPENRDCPASCEPSAGLAEYPVEETLSPKHALQRRERSSTDVRLGSSVKSKCHLQGCIRDSESCMPSPFVRSNLGTLTPKIESTKCSFSFLPAIVYPNAHAQNGSLASKPAAMQLPACVLLPSRAG